MIESDVLDDLNGFLRNRGCALVDTALLAGDLKALIAPFETRARKLVADLIRKLPGPPRPPVYVFFVSEEHYGAMARRGRYDYVLIKQGSIARLLHFFTRIMEMPDVWRELKVADGMPQTERARLALAAVFINECFDFIVLHELAHLVLGHLQPDAQLARRDPIAAQALEAAADGHAMIQGAERLPILALTAGRSALEVAAGYRTFHRTEDDAILNYLLAAFFVFRISDEGHWRDDGLADRAHPPAAFRFHTACIHLDEHFRRAGNSEALARFTAATQKVWERGEWLFAKALDRVPDADFKAHTLSEHSEQHYNLLSDRVQSLPSHLFGLG
jgi:hypothetical protein